MNGTRTTAALFIALSALAIGSLVALVLGVWESEQSALRSDLESALGRASAAPIPFSELDLHGQEVAAPLQSVWQDIEQRFRDETAQVAAALDCHANATLVRVTPHTAMTDAMLATPLILGGSELAGERPAAERELYLHLQRFGLTIRFQAACQHIGFATAGRLKGKLAAFVLIAIVAVMALAGWAAAHRRALRDTELRRDAIDMLAHELANPLTTLQLWAQRKGADQDPRFQRQITRMERLSARIKAASRAVVPEEQSATELINPDQILADVVRERYASQKANGTLSVVHAEGATTVAMDGADLEIVLLNLVDNALQYGGEDPNVVVSTTHSDTSWQVTVCDDGPGFEPSALPAVFGRRHPRNRRRRSSMGLGLYLCGRIARRNGGSIRAENMSRGAKVTLALPRVQS